jgi:hypothetical protein
LGIVGLYGNIQSQNNVFPMHIMIAKETKDKYEVFNSFHYFFLPRPVRKLSAKMEHHIFGKLLMDFKKWTWQLLWAFLHHEKVFKKRCIETISFFTINALLNLIMFIIPMKLNAIIFVLMDGMKVDFVPIMIIQQMKHSMTQKKHHAVTVNDIRNITTHSRNSKGYFLQWYLSWSFLCLTQCRLQPFWHAGHWQFYRFSLWPTWTLITRYDWIPSRNVLNV